MDFSQRSSIVITGASSGIGAALAQNLAREGAALALFGRNAARMEDVAAACRQKGAIVRVLIRDVTDARALAADLAAIDAANPVDLVIANAGISLDETELDDGRAVLEANLTGALNTVLPLIPAMMQRGRGQIALVASIAAFAPLPDAPAYSASKAALLAYGAALRERLRASGVAVSVICPGFVTTPMANAYQGWKPLEIPVDKAARIIIRGLDRNKGLIAFPAPLASAARLQSFVPEFIRQAAMRAFRFRVAPRG